jgi:hypothetical protein
MFERSAGRLAGIAAAVLVGAGAIVAVRVTGFSGGTSIFGVLQLLGIAYAALIGAWLGPRIARGTGEIAFLLVLVYGALVPAAVAVTVMPVPPFVLLALIGSAMVWPVTYPAAGTWALLLRWRPARERLDGFVGATAALVVAALLVAWRFTAPLVTQSTSGELCASFAGETIDAIAWSPSGRWLAITSEHGSAELTIRVLDAGSGAMTTLATGSRWYAGIGLAVDDAGRVTYLSQGAITGFPGDDLMQELWSAAPGDTPRRLGTVPVALTLVGTSAGPAAVIETEPFGRPTRIGAWLRPTSSEIAVVPMTPDELQRYPEVSIELDPEASSFPVWLDNRTVTVARPPDGSFSETITPDRRHLVFQAFALAGDVVAYDHLVAESIESGQRVVLREGPRHWNAIVAGVRLAFIDGLSDENRVCVGPLGVALPA